MLHRPLVAVIAALTLLASGCAVHQPLGSFSEAELTPQTRAGADIAAFPQPKGKIPVAIYSFKDQTGQYKASPGSSFSTAVTQGATAILIKALKDSGWFLPVERENLQDILTERKIARALEQPTATPAPPLRNLTPLTAANLIIEGSIIGYDENVKTGGIGAKYFGISLSQQYRVDQVSVNLRAVDINTGQILESVSTSKTVYSILLDGGVYRFISFKRLLQAEVGVTATEPAAIAVEEAIRTALAHLIVQGIGNRLWTVMNPADLDAPILKEYMDSYTKSLAPVAGESAAPVTGLQESPAAPVPAEPAAPVEVVPAVPPAAAAPAPAVAADVLKGPDETLLARYTKAKAEVDAACTRSTACSDCKKTPVQGSEACNTCWNRVKRCRATRAELQLVEQLMAASKAP